jgi:hypothetical protein
MGNSGSEAPGPEVTTGATLHNSIADASLQTSAQRAVDREVHAAPGSWPRSWHAASHLYCHMESLGATSRRSTDSPPPPPGDGADLQESAADAAELGFLEDDNDLTAPLIHHGPPSPLGERGATGNSTPFALLNPALAAGRGPIHTVRTTAISNAAAAEACQIGNGPPDVCTPDMAEAVYVLSEVAPLPCCKAPTEYTGMVVGSVRSQASLGWLHCLADGVGRWM